MYLALRLMEMCTPKMILPLSIPFLTYLHICISHTWNTFWKDSWFRYGRSVPGASWVSWSSLTTSCVALHDCDSIVTTDDTETSSSLDCPVCGLTGNINLVNLWFQVRLSLICLLDVMIRIRWCCTAEHNFIFWLWSFMASLIMLPHIYTILNQN